MQNALNALLTVGPFALALALLLGSMGVPVPASLMMLAAGAFVRDGRFSPVLVFICAVGGGTVGNIASYYMGQYGLKGIVTRLKRGKSWRKAEKTFKEKGALGIFLTRWLLTPLALPTNLIAGGEKFPLPKFIAACALGTALYTLIYGGIGYAVGVGWRAAGDKVGKYGLWVVIALAVLFGLYELYHWRGHLALHPEDAPPADHTAPA